MFAALVRFKEEHGHFKVPREGKASELGRWVIKQRSRRGKLSPENVKRLEALGFELDPFAALWEKKFAALARFKKEHGHCDVPQGWCENPELGRCVNTQRPIAGSHERFLE